jgi:N-acetylmuramoyl-L-alanine amidase
VPALILATALAVGPMVGAVRAVDPDTIVRPGDTLTAISKRHDVPIATLVKLNDLRDPNRIYAGQRLRLAAPAARTANPPRTPAAAPTQRTHTVRAGEHLTGIARHYGVSIGAIANANGITNPSRIYPGQRLSIPGSPPPRARAASPAASLPASMAALMLRRDEVRRVIVTQARRYGVPEALALAVAWQESGWRQDVVSRAGAIGVMQIMPATGEWVGEAMLGTRVDLRDRRQNVRAGVRLLAHYLARYRGNVDLVLAAYYQGQTAADRHGVYPVSRPYIASIRALVRMLGG